MDYEVNQHELDISAEELKTLQTTDVTLRSVRDAVKTCEAEQGIGFFTRDGLLYRRWVPSGRREEEMAVEQLVLPEKCRKTVMKLAHSIPLAGEIRQPGGYYNVSTGRQFTEMSQTTAVGVMLARRQLGRMCQGLHSFLYL